MVDGGAAIGSAGLQVTDPASIRPASRWSAAPIRGAAEDPESSTEPVDSLNLR
jgi:hypothetical protein